MDSKLLLRCRTLPKPLGLDLSGVEVRLLEEEDGKVDIMSKPEDTEKRVKQPVVVPWYNDSNTTVLLYI